MNTNILLDDIIQELKALRIELHAAQAENAAFQAQTAVQLALLEHKIDFIAEEAGHI